MAGGLDRSGPGDRAPDVEPARSRPQPRRCAAPADDVYIGAQRPAGRCAGTVFRTSGAGLTADRRVFHYEGAQALRSGIDRRCYAGGAATDDQEIEVLLLADLKVQPEQGSHLDFEDFRIALAKLPADQREALLLVGASGFSYEETAHICGCAVGTIKSRVNRARFRLASLLNVEDIEDLGPDSMTRAALQG